MTRKSNRKGAIAGRNPVLETLVREPRRVHKVLVQRGSSAQKLSQIVATARAAGVPLQYVPRAAIDRLAGSTPHQGVAAFVGSIPYRDLDDLLLKVAPTIDDANLRLPMMVVLDGITDPHNLGAILRTCAAVGVGGVVVPAGNTAPLGLAAEKASAGTASMVPVARVRRLSDGIQQLKERGFWVLGLSSSGDVSVWEADWCRPVAVVVGSEEAGMGAETHRACDAVVEIPMAGSVESLNASVAAAVCMFAADRARRSKDG